MRQWLKKNWSDPVWSRVIAWAIYTPIGLAAGTVLLWSQSHFSFNFDIAWAAAVSSLRTIWRWLDNPSNLPQGGLWWTLIASATLIAWMIRQHRREIAVWSARSDGAAAEAQAQASAEMATLRSSHRSTGRHHRKPR